MAERIEQKPFDIQAAVDIVAWNKWYLSRPDIIGDGEINVIPARQADRQMVAVVIQREGRVLTYKEKLQGVVDNLTRGTFTIVFDDDHGDPAYATFPTNRYATYLAFLKIAPVTP